MYKKVTDELAGAQREHQKVKEALGAQLAVAQEARAAVEREAGELRKEGARLEHRLRHMYIYLSLYSDIDGWMDGWIDE